MSSFYLLRSLPDSILFICLFLLCIYLFIVTSPTQMETPWEQGPVLLSASSPGLRPVPGTGHSGVQLTDHWASSYKYDFSSLLNWIMRMSTFLCSASKSWEAPQVGHRTSIPDSVPTSLCDLGRLLPLSGTPICKTKCLISPFPPPNLVKTMAPSLS